MRVQRRHMRGPVDVAVRQFPGRLAGPAFKRFAEGVLHPGRYQGEAKIPVLLPVPVRRQGGQGAKALFALGQFPQPGALGYSHLRFVEHPLQGRRQPREPALADQVAGAGLDGLDGDFLAHRTRHQDEWHVGIGAANDCQRVQAGKARQFEIADDRIPALLRQRGAQIRFRVHTLMSHLDTGALQRLQHRLRRLRRIVDQQQPQLRRTGAGVRGRLAGARQPQRAVERSGHAPGRLKNALHAAGCGSCMHRQPMAAGSASIGQRYVRHQTYNGGSQASALESQLPPGLVDHYCHGVRQVQAAVTVAHGYRQAQLRRPGREHRRRQPLSLRAEQPGIAGGKTHLTVGLRPDPVSTAKTRACPRAARHAGSPG